MKSQTVIGALAILSLTVAAFVWYAAGKTTPSPQPEPSAAHVVILLDGTDSYAPFLPNAIAEAKKIVMGLQPGTKITISTIGADAGTEFLELEHPVANHGPMKYIDKEKMDKQRICQELGTLVNQPIVHTTDILAKLNDDVLPRGQDVHILLYTDARQCDKDGCLEGQHYRKYPLRSIRSLQQSRVCFIGVAREGLSGSDWDKLNDQWKNYIKEHGGSLDVFTESEEATCRVYTK